MRDIENYSKIYEQQGFEAIQVKYRRKMLLEQISKYKPQSILEIGCGLEPLFLYVENVSFTIVEPSTLFCRRGKELLGERKNVLFIENFFENVVEDLLDSKYDMVICSGLLHEVEEPEKLLNAITKICTKDTIIHINVPNAQSLHRLLARESGFIKDEHELSAQNIKLQQHQVFDFDRLIEMVIKSGMSIEEKGSYFVKPFTHEQMRKCLDEGIINKDVLDGLYNLGKYMPTMGSEIFVNCKIENNR